VEWLKNKMEQQLNRDDERMKLCPLCNDKALLILLDVFGEANLKDRIVFCLMYLREPKYIERRLRRVRKTK